jgi:hypothetical protein
VPSLCLYIAKSWHLCNQARVLERRRDYLKGGLSRVCVTCSNDSPGITLVDGKSYSLIVFTATTTDSCKVVLS